MQNWVDVQIECLLKFFIRGVMKRIIKNFKNLDSKLFQKLKEKYPYGIDDEDLISFTTPNGYKIKALELGTREAIYLIKMSSELLYQLRSFTIDREGLDPYSDGYRDSAPFC